jgi:hypothetical protein
MSYPACVACIACLVFTMAPESGGYQISYKHDQDFLSVCCLRTGLHIRTHPRAWTDISLIILQNISMDEWSNGLYGCFSNSIPKHIHLYIDALLHRRQYGEIREMMTSTKIREDTDIKSSLFTMTSTKIREDTGIKSNLVMHSWYASAVYVLLYINCIYIFRHRMNFCSIIV